MKNLLILLLLWPAAIFPEYLQAQPTPVMQQLDLRDMSAFRPQAGNWRIVGSVAIDPSTDIHDKVPAPASGKKPKKGEAPAMVNAQPVTYTEGTGVLLNMNDDKVRSHLLSVMEHGDIELELELTVPKGSNSGIYLQGRYEVQILDSWGVRNPSFSDIGGIYRNWENTPGQIYMGKAPLTNPAKAPGLWQKMRIAFQAPRFDSNGKKISNAKFLTVELNGVQIHSNLEVPLPTGGPIDKTEVANGPLMIQGDHGPVAFRNIRYRLLREVKATVRDISWEIHHGHFKVISDFASRKPESTGSGNELTSEVVDTEDTYAVVYSGKLSVPENGRYTFGLAFTGGARLTVDGTTVIDHQSTDHWPLDYGNIDLKAGDHDFKIYNYKDASWLPPRLAFYAAIDNGKEFPLHAYNSYPPDPNPVSSILLHPGSAPRLLRAFMDFKGDRNRRLTHTIGVGDPSGVNYVYDLKAGQLVCMWRGDFVDATPMWNDRGDGSFRPSGAAEYTFIGQPLAVLGSTADAFPVQPASGFIGKGYEVDPGNGRPIFLANYNGLNASTRIAPDERGRSLQVQVDFGKQTIPAGLHFKLAEGSTITTAADGSWAIDDRRYYIKIAGVQPVIRTAGGQQELVIPVTSGSFSYSIIW